VLQTTTIPEGTALVGAFRECGMALLRLAPRVDFNGFGSEQFISNTVLVRCEERLGLAVTRPTCLLVHGGI
jgi:hypothetical protein